MNPFFKKQTMAGDALCRCLFGYVEFRLVLYGFLYTKKHPCRLVARMFEMLRAWEEQLDKIQGSYFAPNEMFDERFFCSFIVLFFNSLYNGAMFLVCKFIIIHVGLRLAQFLVKQGNVTGSV